ncbi:hypothetical protein NIES2100_14540 [Calothrix sp. NIES-2100]|uniref:hypothetical protein n=1 Tax=Calothrix sp. NIES-2100 TaxID=1954172 RepID=UPI000B61BD24|nr:hypothetical protein NIES2100_14540 [Calothrix sp. NIES-2100]
MGKQLHGTQNQDGSSRHEEKRRNSNTHSGRGGTIGFKSEYSGHQSERADRTNSTGTSHFNFRSGTDGGVVDQLIDEYREQVELKKCAIKNLQVEIKQLEDRIQDFEQVREQLTEASNK